ncbi:MAG: EAL domain-containing protein [Burkholderiaceae bacterium]|nr:EAL domain-containing protein [Burkholderiaceae bacterium]
MNSFARLMQRSLKARIIALFLGLLLVVQVVGFSAIRASLSSHAHRELPGRLDVGDRVLQSLLAQRAQKLTDGARLLAADYGFRDAVNSNDTDTIASVLENHGRRIGATQVALYGADLQLKATTGAHLESLGPLAERLSGLSGAQRLGAADAAQGEIAMLSGQPYQFVMVPIKAPVVVGWVLMGFSIDQRLVADMQALAALQVTLLTRTSAADPWRVELSSMDMQQAAGLSAYSWARTAAAPSMTSVDVRGEEIGVHPSWLTAPAVAGAVRQGGGVLALTSLSVDEATRIPHDLQLALLVVTVLSCALFGIGSAFTAHRVTQPLHRLAAAADRLGAGDYTTPMDSEKCQDEIGQLAQAFERMRVSVSAQKDEILKLAYWDSLTGLPNRAQFRDAVRAAVAVAQKKAASDGAGAAPSVAVLMLDLDRFKHVNDVLGYRFGDLLLMRVAERLVQQSVREGDLVARLGGDEFAILLRHGDAELAQSVAQRIATAFDEPLNLEEHTVDMGAGIGMACWPQHANDADALISRAEVAMYSAKQRSAGALMYDPSIDASSAQTLSLLTEMRLAVGDNQLRLYLQPKLSLSTGLVVGAEALVRWQHPERGLVPPMQFIPFAEQTGFIRVLTMWIFEEAARHWRMLHSEGLLITLSVNLSTRDLLDQDLPQKFDALLVKHQVPAEAFCLEITESAIMDDPQRAQATLERLSAMGFKLSIDDFGTGYSSLAYLKRLPVDELKIDQSFVKSMETDPDDAKIVRSTIDLAHNLGLTVVAEGVENAHVWNMLRDLHCDQAQGYHMGKPMPADTFSNWSAGWLAQRSPSVDLAAALMLH